MLIELFFLLPCIVSLLISIAAACILLGIIYLFVRHSVFGPKVVSFIAWLAFPPLFYRRMRRVGLKFRYRFLLTLIAPMSLLFIGAIHYGYNCVNGNFLPFTTSYIRGIIEQKSDIDIPDFAVIDFGFNSYKLRLKEQPSEEFCNRLKSSEAWDETKDGKFTLVIYKYSEEDPNYYHITIDPSSQIISFVYVH